MRGRRRRRGEWRGNEMEEKRRDGTVEEKLRRCWRPKEVEAVVAIISKEERSLWRFMRH